MILFINPSSRAEVYQSLGDSLAAVEPPIWCRLLASYCEKKGIETDIIDANAEEWSHADVCDFMKDFGHNLAVIIAHGQQPSASTQMMPAVIEMSRAIKIGCPEIPILIVGGHPAALSERTLEETGADFVCTGEGPVTIPALSEVLKAGAMYSSRIDEFNRVPGLCHRIGVNIVRTGPVPNVYSLTEEMPGDMWDKLPMEKYRAHNWHALSNGGERQPYASIYTSLGCSFQCSFCNIQNPFREGDLLKFSHADAVMGRRVNSYRTWPVESVMAEIETLVEEHNIVNLKIADEMFILKPGHVNAVCDAIIERGYGERLNIWCYGRVDCTHEKFLERLRRAGVRWIALGIEAASSDVRDGVEKADYNEDDIYRTCERVRAHGINIMGNFMVGLPSDTHETIKQTLSLALAIRPEFMNVYGMVTYPGSPLWHALPEEKRNYDWATYAHHGYDYTPAGNSTLSPTGIVCWRDEFFRRYFTDEGYLSMVRRKFGEKAEAEIMEMTKVPLKRKLLGD